LSCTLQRYAQLGAGIVESGGDATNGYIKFSNGVILQWGNADNSGDSPHSVSNWFGTSSGTSYYKDATVVFPLSSAAGGYKAIPRIISSDKYFGCSRVQSPTVDGFVARVFGGGGISTTVDWFSIGV